MRARVAVLASGGGTNLQAYLDHLDGAGERRASDVVLVASDRERSGALNRARHRGIETALLPSPSRPDVPSLDALLSRHEVDLVVLAGFLRLVPPEVVRRLPGRVVNVHPALLPAFGGPGMYGERVHQAVIDSGARLTGVTVHFVDDEYDRGRIIAQWPVPVLPGDDARTLAARVLRVEHLLYPRVIEAVAGGRITLESCTRGRASSMHAEHMAYLLATHADAALAQGIDLMLEVSS